MAIKRPWSGTADDTNLPKDAQQLVRAMNELSVARQQGNIITVLHNSKPCTEVMAAMDGFVNSVETGDVPYNFVVRNSNSVAYGLLEAASEVESTIKHPYMIQHPKLPVFGYTGRLYEETTGKKHVNVKKSMTE
jgi:hypothetical protein